MKITEILAEWVENLRFEDIPPQCRTKAKEQLISIAGATIAGAGMEEGKAVAETFRELSGTPTSTVLGCGFETNAPNAAFVNSFNAQILEWDDWVIPSHSGASVVPTALAVGEAVGATGKDFLLAIIVGNEINGRTGRALLKGFNIGNSIPNHQIDSVLVAGKLLGLNAKELMKALGISCVMAMEICPIGYTSDAKGFLNALPVQNGITAALMAQKGLIGSQEILEHPMGFLSTASEEIALEQVIADLGKTWVTLTIHTKPYPLCGWHISIIDSALELVNKHKIPANQIKEIIAYVPGVSVVVGTRYSVLKESLYDKIKKDEFTHMALHFDFPYPIAAAIVDREMTHRQFAKERIFDPLIQKTAKKVKLKTDIALHRAYSDQYKFGARIKIEMKDGRVYEHLTPQMKGAPDNPLDVREKFLTCTKELVDAKKADTFLSMAWKAENISNIRKLTEILQ